MKPATNLGCETCDGPPHKRWCPRSISSRHARRESGTAVASIIRAASRYQRAYWDLYQSKIADDGVLGPPFKELLLSALALLKGELGDMEGGILDGEIRRVATEAGFDGGTL